MKKVTILAAMHGDEVYGVQLYNAFVDKFSTMKPFVQLVIGNEPAYRQGVRFIDSDMNRSFRLSATNNETKQINRLNNELMQFNPDYILDIHTTRRDSGIFWIVGSLNATTRKICGIFNFDICIMKDEVVESSFIGNSNTAVSLEYSLSCINQEQTDIFLKGLSQLIRDSVNRPQRQRVYEARSLISELQFKSYPNLKNYDEQAEGVALMVPKSINEMDAEYYGFWCTRTE